MNDFDYAAATSLDEAVRLLAERGAGAKVLAGGTDLIVQLREGLKQAELVVDVKKIPELMQLEYSPAEGLRLGAAVPCYQLCREPQVAAAYPGLIDAARIIGGWQIQSRASIGGNLCNGSPAADSIPPLIVYGGICRIAGADGIRTVPAEEFCVGPGKTILKPGELLVALELPPPAPRSGAHYLRFIPRNEMDIAVAGAAAWLQLDDAGETVVSARIALGAVAPTPVVAQAAEEFLAGKTASEANFREAAELAKQVARPISDMRGPADYRTHLVGVLSRRALQGADQRARGAS